VSNQTWTTNDEQRLQEMLVRKQLFTSRTRAKLEEVVEQFFYSYMSANDIVDELIKHADDIRDALQPYDSGVRVAVKDEA